MKVLKRSGSALVVLVLASIAAFHTPSFAFVSTKSRLLYSKSNLHYNNHGNMVLHSLSEQSTPSRDMASLQDWARENGVQFHNHVGLVSSNNDDGSDDWGVSLLHNDSPTTTLKAGTVVLTVPSRLVLSSTRVAFELSQEYNLDPTDCMTLLNEQGFANQYSEFLLFVKILMEHAKGSVSLWQPWLQSLPQSFSTGVCMNSFERSCLSPFALALTEFETSKLQAFRQALSCLIQQPAASESSILSLMNELVSKQDDVVTWAYNVVFSRCWQYADQVGRAEVGRSDIVPLGDMFNHADDANVVVNYEEKHQDGVSDDTAEHEIESDDAVKFVLTKDVEMNHDESPSLCLSYGLTTNPYRFLIIFGFVNDQMEEIYCQVLFTNPSKEMVELGCNDRSKMVYRTYDGGISDTVWTTVLYSLLEQQIGNPDAEAMRKELYRAHLNDDGVTKARIREKYLLETSLTLRNHVLRTLREFDELVDQVENIIQASGGLSVLEKEHAHIGMIHRHNCFLQGVFQKVRDRLDGMVQSETMRRRQTVSRAQ